MGLTLGTRLDTIHGIGPRFLARLHALHIETVRDLLWHFPFRYEDFSQLYRIADLEPGQQATVRGTVQEIDVRRTWQKRIIIIEATIADETGTIRAVWFNQPYIKNVLRPGKLANFSGKVSVSDSEHDLYLSHPTYELVGAHDTRHTGRLVPIYPETRGLTSKGIRFLTQPILEHLPEIPDWLPADVLTAEHLPDITTALRTVHFPAAIDDAIVAKKRFAFEDLFLLQLVNFEQKARLAAERAPEIPVDIALVKRMLAELPFALTHSQKQALWEVIQNIGKPRPMNRLLQGDVGSGKTVVAALAAILAARAGYQTTIMAPTEVLAHQHFATFQKLLARVVAAGTPALALVAAGDIRLVGDGGAARVSRAALLRQVGSGAIPIVIGTHALIQKSIAFKNLGLVVIDEQHRFGVDQRAALLKKNGGVRIPHFLSMSATPIPRTLMLTVFGDLDLSTITELPAGRKPITTKLVPPEDRTKIYAFIRAEIRKGRQAFVICPRIDPSRTDADNTPTNADKKLPRLSAHGQQLSALLEMKSVKEEYEKLSKTIFPDLRIAMLHGQMKAKEKERIMKDFRDGKSDILVSTSVIEVGVDVPNATIMMIEGSERFGLSQLYQFRGRVGRGEHQSYCMLFTDSVTAASRDRLKAIVEAKNGFELAEHDLKLRGPGEFLGEKQTGLPDVAMAGLQNPELIRASRAAAEQLLTKDPTLSRATLLRTRLAEFKKNLHVE
jgi:ATP-dependent DNA helicase RecG